MQKYASQQDFLGPSFYMSASSTFPKDHDNHSVDHERNDGELQLHDMLHNSVC